MGCCSDVDDTMQPWQLSLVTPPLRRKRAYTFRHCNAEHIDHSLARQQPSPPCRFGDVESFWTCSCCIVLKDGFWNVPSWKSSATSATCARCSGECCCCAAAQQKPCALPAAAVGHPAVTSKRVKCVYCRLLQRCWGSCKRARCRPAAMLHIRWRHC